MSKTSQVYVREVAVDEVAVSWQPYKYPYADLPQSAITSVRLGDSAQFQPCGDDIETQLANVVAIGQSIVDQALVLIETLRASDVEQVHEAVGEGAPA